MPDSISKSELIAQLASRQPQLAARDVELAINAMLDAMARAMAQGRNVEIRGFGTFYLSQREARRARNPRTGEEITVPSKALPRFRPGKELRERVDSP